MPSRAPSVCTHCGEPHTGICAKRAAAIAARKARADRRRPSSSERGYDAAWEKLRADYLAAYPSCARCGQKAHLVDHKITIAKAPERRLDPSNLQSLCTPCHSSWKQAQDRKA
ncbi:MAG: HNH endonuclease [Devosia sp.]|uniref:HNH endonuclease n=1 Tax=Devosia sp. 66-22 TaxID=1895753 RepID=UPI0009281A69|nr:HNH endonuclease signature motif containing protein [Devosia sp. 66-22]MBN9347561.1 HNH endonuclease [Devosia sp.]OJX50676.1 MAG: hypothetical protein BGO81_20725 [Devosia sp. 66-22]